MMDTHCLIQFLYRKTCNVSNLSCSKCNALRNLLPFVQFKKREKQRWSTTFSKIGKSNTTPWVPNKMNKCIYGINGTKSNNATKILLPK